MFILLFLLFTSNTPDAEINETVSQTKSNTDVLSQAITTLKPNAKEETINLVVETVEKWGDHYGFKTLNEKLLLIALIKQESNFRHIHGNDNEWGMLQVIPFDIHTQKLAVLYKCHKDEIEKGLCRCPIGKDWKKTDPRCNIPNIRFLKKGKWHISSRKLNRFLAKAVRGSLAIGIGELSHWRKKYKLRYKRIFWKYFPKTHLTKRIKIRYSKVCKTEDKKDTELCTTLEGKQKYIKDYLKKMEKWWYYTKKKLKSKVWVCHHNYGGRIKLSTWGRAYPHGFFRKFKKIKE